MTGKNVKKAEEYNCSLIYKAFDCIDFPTIVINTNFQIIISNQAAKNQYYMKDNGSPKLCYQVFHDRNSPCESAGHSCPLKQVHETLLPVKLVHEHIQKNGEKRVVELTTSPLFDDNNKLTGIIETARDITEHNQIMEALRISEKRFRLAFHSNPEAFTISGLDDGLIVDVNQGFCDMTGYKFNEVIGKSVQEINIWANIEDRTRFSELLKKTGQVKNMEFSFLMKDGQIKRGLATSNTFELNGVPHLISFARNIEAQKQAEEDLIDSKNTAELYLNIAAGIILSIDIHGNITLLNESGHKLLGYDNGTLIGRNWFETCLPETIRSEKRTAFDKLLHEESGNLEICENPILLRDGTEKTILWHNSILKDKEGHTIGTLSSGEDITERYQTEEILRLHSSIFENMAEGIFLIGMDDGIIKFTNSIFDRMFGYDNGKLVGKSVEIVNALINETPGGINTEIVKALQEIGEWHGEIENIRKDGTHFWCYANVSLFDYPNYGRLIVSINNDITEHKLAEEKIAVSLVEKEVLLREIHHRVKNNMQVIVSLLRIHSRRIKDKDLLHVFDDCRNRINAMSLIHETLCQSADLGRIDFGSYLKKLCENIGYVYSTSKKKIIVKVKVCEITLGIDQGLAVGTIVSELVGNAYKHAFTKRKEGEILISMSIENEKQVKLVVGDDGVGLPEEINLRESKSLGLKLTANTVTRDLDGSFEVERNHGTRFIIRFKASEL